MFYRFGIIVRDKNCEQRKYISIKYSSIGETHKNIKQVNIRKMFPDYRYVEGAWIENENKKMIVLDHLNNYKIQVDKHMIPIFSK